MGEFEEVSKIEEKIKFLDLEKGGDEEEKLDTAMDRMK